LNAVKGVRDRRLGDGAVPHSRARSSRAFKRRKAVRVSQTQARFMALWSRSGGLDNEAVYDDLARLYAEPTRHYHTLRHIRRCLRDLDWARNAIPHPDAVELALWCHDVIYVPGAPDNEQRSVEWFRRWADGRIASGDRICDMILATKRFREDGARLRAERPDLDDRAYDSQERMILGSLLARPRIYLTDYFHARCEVRARGNLSWRLGLQTPE